MAKFFLQRDRWNKEIDFLLSIIGFCVDLANIWRFPFLVYINGGGAFLIPYFLMLIFGALPLFYMELLVGQIQQESCISVWQLCPFFKGVGVSQVLINLCVSSYYNVLIAYSLFYFLATIVSGLPWLQCDPSFSTIYCLNASQMQARNLMKENYTANNLTWPPPNVPAIAQLPTQEYFERAVLGVQYSLGLEDIGTPRWQLVVCTGIVFTLLFFCLWKGIKASGKVVYVTVCLPYILLTAILIQGCLLEGSRQGIEFFLIPDFNKLKSSQVWLDAAVQIFYSVGAGFGVHITLSSYNKQNANCLRNCLITAFVNSFTSLLAGFTVFTYLGYMSFLTGQDIKDVANEGPGLVFQVYPLAVGSLPLAPLWSLLFFLLLIMLGMDSSMGGIESLITAIRDEFRSFFNRYRGFTRELTTFLVILVSFLFSLVNVTDGGILVLQIIDRSVGIPLVVSALGQAIAIAWFYGLPQFCKDINETCGYVPNILWRICWKVISPIFIIAVVTFSFLNLPPLAYRFGAYHPELEVSLNVTTSLDYEFPSWTVYVIWGLSGVQMVMIPLFMLIAVIRYQSFYYAVTPTWEHSELDCGVSPIRKKVKYWFSFGPVSRNTLTYELNGQDNPVCYPENEDNGIVSVKM